MNKKSNKNLSDGTTADNSTKAQETKSSHNSSKPPVGGSLSNRKKRIIGSFIRDVLDSNSYIIWTESFCPTNEDFKKYLDEYINQYNFSCRCNLLPKSFIVEVLFENDKAAGIIQFEGTKNSFTTNIKVKWN